jgi:hypothetical protein
MADNGAGAHDTSKGPAAIETEAASADRKLSALQMKRSLRKLMTDKGSRGVHDARDRYPQYGSGNDQQQPGDGEEGDSRSEPARHNRIMAGPRPKAQGLVRNEASFFS